MTAARTAIGKTTFERRSIVLHSTIDDENRLTTESYRALSLSLGLKCEPWPINHVGQTRGSSPHHRGESAAEFPPGCFNQARMT